MLTYINYKTKVNKVSISAALYLIKLCSMETHVWFTILKPLYVYYSAWAAITTDWVAYTRASYFFTLLEARSKIKISSRLVSGEVSLSTMSLCPHSFFSVCAKEETDSLIGSGSNLMTSFNLNYVLKVFISIYSHIRG